MADKKQWLEVVLKKKHYEESPVEVIAIEDSSNVVGKGENYLSQIERVKATVLLGNGKTKKISLIIKNQHETEQMKKLSLELGVFFREITMYRDILPKMEDLLNEINDSEGIMWGRCFDYRLFDRLVFEDLNVMGYKMADRKKQLGLDSALLVIKSLAKFHALSKILLDRGEIPMDIFGKHIWTRNPESTIEMVTKNAERLLSVMKTWGDDWNEAVDRFEKALPDLGKRYVEELNPKPDEFVVLCHGDCWTNNMLFKGDDLEKPTSVKLLDMQIFAITSPAFDFHVFVGSSVRSEVIKNHYDEIIRAYYSSFETYSKALNPEVAIPSFEETKSAIEQKCVLMMGWALILGHLVTADTSDHPSPEDSIKEEVESAAKGEEVISFNPFRNFNDSTKNMYRSCIEKCIEFGSM